MIKSCSYTRVASDGKQLNWEIIDRKTNLSISACLHFYSLLSSFFYFCPCQGFSSIENIWGIFSWCHFMWNNTLIILYTLISKHTLTCLVFLEPKAFIICNIYPLFKKSSWYSTHMTYKCWFVSNFYCLLRVMCLSLLNGFV